VDRPARELKGFQKVFIPAGKTKRITIAIPIADLAYYNVARGAWEVEPTRYDFSIGNSSRDVQASGSIQVE
jgi:beta-glucosidase